MVSKKSPSLSSHLTHAINDFIMIFKKRPRVIRLPSWRQEEMEDETILGFKLLSCNTKEKSFNGITVIFVASPGFNQIELQ